jgi:DNA processing protein
MDWNVAYEIAALHFVKGLGMKNSHLLLQHFGSARAIFDAPVEAFTPFSKQAEVLWSKLHGGTHWTRAEEVIIHAQKYGYSLLHWEHPHYPQRLRFCPDAPLLLYGKGPLPFHAKRVVSIVGTRKATPYGLRMCRRLVEGLAHPSMLIISGLALGIDRCAHACALEVGLPTIGVLGHGIDRVYPPQHQKLVDDMCQKGGILTEFPYGTAPEKKNFPIRNRIIAGLADLTIVVEAAEKGGALITAEFAHGYARELAAFPGHVDQPYSAGCNALIVHQKAVPIRHAEDVWALMQWDPPHPAPSNHLKKQVPLLSDMENKLFRWLSQYTSALHVSQLSQQLGWESGDLALHLLQLEMKGLIQVSAGGYYQVK